jgi:catechol-2,3-dioxygenase
VPESNEQFELEPPTGIVPPVDVRPLIPIPPPVRLVAVEDVLVHAGDLDPALRAKVEDFYVRLLGFELRERDIDRLVLQGETHRLIYDFASPQPPPPADGYRFIGLEVPTFRDLEPRLRDAEVEYERQRGIHPGADKLVMRDPAGQWLEVTERRAVM